MAALAATGRFDPADEQWARPVPLPAVAADPGGPPPEFCAIGHRRRHTLGHGINRPEHHNGVAARSDTLASRYGAAPPDLAGREPKGAQQGGGPGARPGPARALKARGPRVVPTRGPHRPGLWGQGWVSAPPTFSRRTGSGCSPATIRRVHAWLTPRSE
ncbi:hypothetical protein Nans01_39720 [Nocardiopsis ansamitocini]|uniref:Uncharacterized protein n=1 Tax=Nocardiopsis ansamitocini TaxID=1670832 RepID=A0A9W6UI66_9ACTN|nr:hypothetical protein Nans01_39720 [Nocardiopsis ansamitocini]